MIHVRLVRLPPESSVWTEVRGEPYWTVAEHLIDEVRMALVHSTKHKAKPHPQRPRGLKGPAQVTPKRRRVIANALARKAERQRQIEAGEIT